MAGAATLRPMLEAGISRLGLAVEPAAVDDLLAYLELLQRWNSAYNLTAIREPGDMVRLHLLDCLALVPYLPDARGPWIDIGSGAGLPGIVLALLDRERSVDLLDSNGKKTRFLFQVKTALGLANMTVHHARAEDFEPAQAYQVVLSRAFATLADMVECSRRLRAPGGRWLAMKGTLPSAEIAALPDDIVVSAQHRIVVPDLAAERHLLELVTLDDSRG
jgi:16S rRNA (guanine527-N7)-methyltransferase